MSFEQIVSFVSEQPKHFLSANTPEAESLYDQLKKATKKMSQLDYTLERLEKEFRDSYEAS
jgi:hypothetical protein